MNTRYQQLADRLEQRFGERLSMVVGSAGDAAWEIDRADLVEVCKALRDEPEFDFSMLIDVCGVDYLTYGQSEWETRAATSSGFSRGRSQQVIVADADTTFDAQRFAVVYQLLSLSNNVRLRLRVFTGEQNPPVVPSVVGIWSSADWYERETFDLFGILFDGHPDLRRILTDYGFIGHPFRKDFPVIGNVEMRYDEAQERVVYEPVSIEPRVLVPKTIREDNRYSPDIREHGEDG